MFWSQRSARNSVKRQLCVRYCAQSSINCGHAQGPPRFPGLGIHQAKVGVHNVWRFAACLLAKIRFVLSEHCSFPRPYLALPLILYKIGGYLAMKVGFCQGVFQFVEVLAACCQQTLPQLRLQRSSYRVTNIGQKASRHPRLPDLRFQQEDVNDMASHRMKYENGIEPYSMKNNLCA